MSIQEKMEVKRLGPDRPDLKPHLQSKRKFSSDFYMKFVWLTGCISTKRVYCFQCLLFGQSKKEETFSKIGIDDWGHLTQKCKKHEESKSHLDNCCSFSIFGRVNVLEELSTAARIVKSQHNLEVDRNRHILSRIIDCIKFCGLHELALRGSNESEDSENPGIFLGLVKMQSELDSTLKSHLESATVFKGTSKDIQNELLSVMFDVCQEKIKVEINNADFLAVISDDTTDVSQFSQNVVVLRYLVKGTLVERFWSFAELDGGDAQTIAERVIDCLKTVLPLPGDDKKLIAQCYDGAAVMSGANGGVHIKVRECYENAHYLHCYAHQLNLIVQHAVSSEKQCRVFFSNVNGFATFFHLSPKRTKFLDEATTIRIPSSSKTRTWNFAGRIVKTLYENTDDLVKCLDNIIEQWTGKEDNTVSQAIGLKGWLEDPEFLLYLNFFNKILTHVSLLFNALQNRKIDPTAVASAISHFNLMIDHERNEVGSLVIDDESLAKRRKKDCTIETVRVFSAVCDQVKSDCMERFAFTNHLVAATLLESSNFKHFNSKFPTAALQATVEAYPFLHKKKLQSELEILYCRPELRKSSGALSLLQLLLEDDMSVMKDQFNECVQLMKVIVTTPMTSSEAERCFSTLNRIKNYLRNSMKTDRLNALAMLSMEKKIISEDDFNTLVIDKFCSQKVRRAKFLYR